MTLLPSHSPQVPNICDPTQRRGPLVSQILWLSQSKANSYLLVFKPNIVPWDRDLKATSRVGGSSDITVSKENPDSGIPR
jgi:hypothetical protein